MLVKSNALNLLTPKELSGLVKHLENGDIEISQETIGLFRTESEGYIINYIWSIDFTDEARKQKILNAKVLDFLLENQHLIPEDWKQQKRIFFAGTIYEWAYGMMHARYLMWNGNEWESSSSSLAWGDDPVAIYLN